MIIELLVGAGLVAAGAIALRALQRRATENEPAEELAGHESVPTPPARAGEGGRPSPTGTSIRAGGPRGLRVDDVLLFADDEMWLAGEIHLDEEGFALSLFRTPGSPRSEWVAQLDPEAREVALLSPTAEVPDGVVPTELPVGGLRLSLRRRGQAEVRTAGESLPPATERARWAVLGGPGGRLLVVVDFQGGDRLALLGETVSRSLLDLLPGGEAG